MENALKDGLVQILKIAKDNPILVEKRNNQLYVGTYTDYHKVVYQTPVKHSLENFRAVISTEIAKNLPDMIVGDIEIDESSLSFTSNHNKTKIALIQNPITLTSLAKGYEKENNASFSTNELREAFFYTKHASNDKTIGDLVMRGFHFTINPSACEVMASNGAILSLVKLYQTNPDFNKSHVLLLNPDFFNVLKLLQGEITSIGFNENSISLTSENENHTLRVISSLVSGKNLPYESVVSASRSSARVKYVVNKRSFLEAVKQVKVFSENSAELKVFNTGEFEIKTEGNNGSAIRSIDVITYENEINKNIVIKLNVQMLFSYLLSSKEELVSVFINSEESPILFEDTFGLNILAPLRK
jgi:hypothetical protein